MPFESRVRATSSAVQDFACCYRGRVHKVHKEKVRATLWWVGGWIFYEGCLLQADYILSN